jgi:hypothetical protein
MREGSDGRDAAIRVEDPGHASAGKLDDPRQQESGTPGRVSRCCSLELTGLLRDPVN